MGQEGRIASQCQISSKSIKPGPRLAIFRFLKMPAAATLGFLNYKFLTVGRVMSDELRHHATFSGDRSNRCRYKSILDISMWRLPPS